MFFNVMLINFALTLHGIYLYMITAKIFIWCACGFTLPTPLLLMLHTCPGVGDGPVPVTAVKDESIDVVNILPGAWLSSTTGAASFL